jgi:Cdc6-like AAA superfamily ATPase
MKHLENKTRDFVETASLDDRILATRSFKWVGYTHAINILKKMDDCMTYPKSHRMPNILLVGDSNNGKTAILNRFNQRHLSYIDKESDKLINPVVFIQAPPEPDEKRFYNAILEKLFAPYRTSEKIDSRYMRVKNLLFDLETKILIIDEIHHVLAGSASKQRSFLNVIKHLSNDLQIPLVCSGTKMAFNAIQTDHQLANRFEPRVLPRWSNDLELKRLLISFERLLPLKKESNLIENSMVSKILSLSDGLIGEVAKILELSTVLALESGGEKITKNIVNSIDYISPQERKKKFYY